MSETEGTRRRIKFCEKHWSWLCGVGQGKCQAEVDPPAPAGDSGGERG